MRLPLSKALLVGLSVFAFVSLLTASVASANTFTGSIFLDPTNSTLLTGCGGGLCPGPYATVTITTDGTNTAHIEFDALATGGYQYLFISPDIVELVLSTTSVTVSNITYGTSNCAGCSGFGDPGPFTATVADNQHVDGLGNYNLVLDGDNGYTDAITMIAFDVVLNSGTWGSANTVIDNTKNSQSWINSITGLQVDNQISWAGAHIAVCGTPTDCTPSNAALATAWAGGAVTRVAEPGTLSLLGAALILVGAVARRFQN